MTINYQFPVMDCIRPNISLQRVLREEKNKKYDEYQEERIMEKERQLADDGGQTQSEAYFLAN